jgi:hypothetical protein
LWLGTNGAPGDAPPLAYVMMTVAPAVSCVACPACGPTVGPDVERPSVVGEADQAKVFEWQVAG